MTDKDLLILKIIQTAPEAWHPHQDGFLVWLLDKPYGLNRYVVYVCKRPRKCVARAWWNMDVYIYSMEVRMASWPEHSFMEYTVLSDQQPERAEMLENKLQEIYDIDLSEDQHKRIEFRKWLEKTQEA
jgi:hypothetical protein